MILTYRCPKEKKCFSQLFTREKKSLLDLLYRSAVVESTNQMLSAGPDKRRLDGREQDPVELLNIMLLHLLGQQGAVVILWKIDPKSDQFSLPHC